MLVEVTTNKLTIQLRNHTERFVIDRDMFQQAPQEYLQHKITKL